MTAPSRAAPVVGSLTRPVGRSLLRRAWHHLPPPLQRLALTILTWTGVPYVLWYFARYGETHSLESFAGHLDQIKRAWPQADGAARLVLERRFEAVVEGLVMPNGVSKTTYGARQARAISRALELPEAHIPRDTIRILDVPSSTGSASLHNLELLSQRYQIAEYVLGDLYHHVLVDGRRRCVFDERGHLLQVGFVDRFFSVYLPHERGNEYTIVSDGLMAPHHLLAAWLRRRCRFERSACVPVAVVHPEVERRLPEGVFRLQPMDVFRPIPGTYDVILSFNLLQRNYFPAKVIARGVANLTAALADGGLLLMGNTGRYAIYQKQNGRLEELAREGEF